MEHIQSQLAQIESRIAKEERRLTKFLHFLTHTVGGLWFLIFNAVLLLGWIEWNLGLFGLPIFDPYPFSLLALVFGVEAVCLSSLVLLNQAHTLRKTSITQPTLDAPKKNDDTDLHTTLRKIEDQPRLSGKPDVIHLPESKTKPREITLEEIQREIERNSDF